MNWVCIVNSAKDGGPTPHQINSKFNFLVRFAGQEVISATSKEDAIAIGIFKVRQELARLHSHKKWGY